MSLQVFIEIILHATEDASKIYEAFETIFGFDKDHITQMQSEGHYGNMITILRAEAKKSDAERIIEMLIKGLGKAYIADMLEEISTRLASSGLHIRLDKQKFVQGRIAFEEGGAIHVRIYTPVYVKKNAQSQYKLLFEKQSS